MLEKIKEKGQGQEGKCRTLPGGRDKVREETAVDMNLGRLRQNRKEHLMN